MKGICILSNIPLRKEANSKSEIVSTILFGETFTIENQGTEWTKIITTDDSYEGYISSKQYVILSQLLTHTQTATGYPFSILKSDTGLIMVPYGAQLPNFNDSKCTINNIVYTIISPQFSEPLKDIAIMAKQFLNAPYLWGGKTVFGIDCSGFTQVIYKVLGTQLPRDAYQQAEMGETIAFLEHVQPGDLAYFDNDEGKITHVGIMLNSHQIIHASGQVRIDPIDSHGIMNTETQQYSHKLRIIKRVIIVN